MVEQITSAKLLVLFETYSIFDVIIFNWELRFLSAAPFSFVVKWKLSIVFVLQDKEENPRQRNYLTEILNKYLEG